VRLTPISVVRRQNVKVTYSSVRKEVRHNCPVEFGNYTTIETYAQMKPVINSFDIGERLSDRGQLKCDGTRAYTRFRLSAKRTNSFKSAGGVSSVDYWQPRCAHQR